MPEALARSDNDFTISSPQDRPAPRRVSKPAGRETARAKPRVETKSVAIGAMNLLRARPARSVAIAAMAAIALGIVVNALAMQKTRHPAPLFVVPAAAGQAVPGNSALLSGTPVPTPRPVNEPAASVDHGATPRHAAPEKDLIAQLLRPHVMLPGQESPKAPEPSKSVMKAQQALVKLGFVLRPDGVLGGTTRQAIERFERDRGLPVKGDLTPKIRRQLMAQSGIAME